MGYHHQCEHLHRADFTMNDLRDIGKELNKLKEDIEKLKASDPNYEESEEHGTFTWANVLAAIDNIVNRSVTARAGLTSFTQISAVDAASKFGLTATEFVSWMRGQSVYPVLKNGIYTLMLASKKTTPVENTIVYGALGDRTGMTVEIIEQNGLYSCYINEKNNISGLLYYGCAPASVSYISNDRSMPAVSGVTVNITTGLEDKMKTHYVAVPKTAKLTLTSVKDSDGDDIKNMVVKQTIDGYDVYSLKLDTYIDNTTIFRFD